MHKLIFLYLIDEVINFEKIVELTGSNNPKENILRKLIPVGVLVQGNNWTISSDELYESKAMCIARDYIVSFL